MNSVEIVSQLFQVKVFEINNTFLILIFFGRDWMIDGSSNLVDDLSYNSQSLFQRLITRVSRKSRLCHVGSIFEENHGYIFKN